MMNNKKDDLFEQYKIALDIRKFEIDLYWKRALYFWAFIITFLGAYSATFISSNIAVPYVNLVRVVICLLGFVINYCWYEVCRGSKYWQENWEAKVIDFEKELGIDVYRSQKQIKSTSGILSNNRSSISDLNQFVSFSFLLLWICISIVSIYFDISGICKCSPFSILHAGVYVLFVISFIYIKLKIVGKHKGGNND